MDHEPIVLHLRMKGMALDSIHDDLVRTFGKDAVAYSTVTEHSRNAQFSGRKEATPTEAPDVEGSLVDEAILTALTEFPFQFPFSSVCELSQRICLPRSTVHRHLTQYFASRCDIFDGSPTFDDGIEADSAPDGNRTIAGPLDAKHAPVARDCHLGRVADLFGQ
jgi:hypothetical protein